MITYFAEIDVIFIDVSGMFVCIKESGFGVWSVNIIIVANVVNVVCVILYGMPHA